MKMLFPYRMGLNSRCQYPLIEPPGSHVVVRSLSAGKDQLTY
ncbi:MAG TPA: hypothetical protein VGF16_11435 [Bryobacteraceae bacterium]|jgi:hypothetical protein